MSYRLLAGKWSLRVSFEGSVQGIFQGSTGDTGVGRVGRLWPVSL